MNNIYFTADTHFGHHNIIKYCERPYANVNAMDEELIDLINQSVKTNDILWHLGDFSFRNPEIYRSRIKCSTVNIIWGNHDRDYTFNLKKSLFNRDYDLTKIKVGKQDIILCHYAMAVWNKSHHGSWQLYGHSHSQAENNLNNLFKNRRSMDVGVDNAKKILGEYRPFSYEEIESIMSRRSGHHIDHH